LKGFTLDVAEELYGFLIRRFSLELIGLVFIPFLVTECGAVFSCPMAAILGLQQRLFLNYHD
jgi:hypothetical protein